MEGKELRGGREIFNIHTALILWVSHHLCTTTSLWVWLCCSCPYNYRREAVELTRPYLYNDSIDDVFEREPFSILVTSKTLGMQSSCYGNK